MIVYMSTHIVSPRHDKHTDNPLVAIDDEVSAHLLQRETCNVSP